MIRVTIESAYRTSSFATVEDNVRFARDIFRWAFRYGYAPFASHLLYTQPGILDDNTPGERNLGIQAGLVWSSQSDEVWFCLRRGEKFTEGMETALEYHQHLGNFIQIKHFDYLDGRFTYLGDAKE